MGSSRPPAAATRPEPMPKVMMVIFSELTPMSLAASLFCAVALTDLPRSVLSRKKNRAAVRTSAMMKAMTMGMLKESSPM